jgi:hypothetical protein
MRAWIEIPAEWGWGPVQALKAQLARAGYCTEEYRGTGPVMLAVTGGRPAPGTPRPWPPGQGAISPRD